MIEVLSILGGAVVRLLTWGTQYLSTRQENHHELALLKLQLQLEKTRTADYVAEMEAVSRNLEAPEADETFNSLVASTVPKSRYRYLDAINGFIRPALTFWWSIVLYTVYKGFIIYEAVLTESSALQFSTLLISGFDTSVIGSIIGFWFCDRALRKHMGR